MKRTARSTIAAAIGAVLAAVCCLGPAPTPAAAQQPAQPKQASPKAAVDAQERRLQQLEDQMLDLQAMIGTFQSLIKGGAAPDRPPGVAPVAPVAPAPAAQPGALPGDMGQRIDVIETQIRALSGQMEQITAQLAQLQAALAGGAVPQQPGVPVAPGQVAPGQAPPPFGTLTVEPEQVPPQQTVPQATPQQPQSPPQAEPLPYAPPAQARAVTPDAATRAVYEAAYNQLLQRDFKSAEAGFRDFLAAYPDDPLAANAQYWLGETYYVRGKYREAADSFLTGYRKHRDSGKGPANLLKLGMSLGQLGQKDAACATFGELAQKYPNAPQHLKQRAASERSRAGC